MSNNQKTTETAGALPENARTIAHLKRTVTTLVGVIDELRGALNNGGRHDLYLHATETLNSLEPTIRACEDSRMKRFRIIETNVYELDAMSADEAEKAFLEASPAHRDGVYFQEVEDREISEIDRD